ncbi:hypothetical protein SAMN05661012_06474 [Chitinophaga sancti]|uniref:Uncharacterized protein n=1 Tax=Chitinophaga sancti TaxID=1004 RepID=A0A1K1T0Q9_9BACT|nr:hypothetical protein SAMN05661012_06474 [Chitinophaga sancti]
MNKIHIYIGEVVLLMQTLHQGEVRTITIMILKGDCQRLKILLLQQWAVVVKYKS